MEFRSNRDVLAAFEAIGSEGQELSAPPEENAEPQETGPDAEEKEDTDNGSVS